ncbi:MAG: hypothetical protein RML40_10835 [Bacteroidota bacterium]|nr:hypothetical protein [Bacteroidota bacterium]
MQSILRVLIKRVEHNMMWYRNHFSVYASIIQTYVQIPLLLVRLFKDFPDG